MKRMLAWRRCWWLAGSGLALILSARATNLHADELGAAAAKLDITPPVGHQLWGLSLRAGPSTGKLDPLFARVLVLKSQASSLAIVALDLGRTFGDEHMADLRTRVKSESGIDHVIFAASHTHTAPTPLNKKYIPEAGERWESQALERIAAAINESSRNAVAYRVGAGKGAAYIGHNRQDPIAGGRWIGKNPNRLRTSPMDPIVQVLRFDDSQGKPIAVVANYAAHPVVLDSVNGTEYSADFPGVMADYVEEKLPGKPVCLFIQGACGDINSLYVGQYPSTEKGPGGWGVLVREMRRLGRELGAEVLRVAEKIQSDSPLNPEVRAIDETMKFRSRWDLDKLKSLDAVPTYHQWLAEGRPRGYPPEEPSIFLTTALIDRQIAILTMPGEPYVDHQIGFRDRLPGLDTILAGYSNGYVGYLPTIRAAVRDGVVYGANAWPTILEVGAGERIVDRGIVNVYRMLGLLKEQPDPDQAMVVQRK